MTVTREWLEMEIAAMEAARDEMPFGLSEDGTRTLAALKMLLAGMIQPVPVAVPESWESCTHLLPIGELIRRIEEQTGEKVSYASDAARHVRDLVMMVKLLARTVTKYNPGSQQAKDFIAYLQREGLISATDCLRDGINAIRSSGVALDADKILAERDDAKDDE